MTSRNAATRSGYPVGNGALAVFAAVALVACSHEIAAPPRPAKLAFITPPSDAIAGVAISPGIRVAIEDVDGNKVPNAANSVTVTLGVNVAGGTLSGTKTVNAVNGVATFPDLAIDKASTLYSLTAASGALTSASSLSFTVGAAAPATLTFAAPPNTTASGDVIAPPVQVTIQDKFGNTVTNADNPVTVTLGGTPTGATLSGTLTTNAVRGVATFSDLSIDKANTGFALTASSGALTAVTSPAFNINPPRVAAKLAFITTPSSWTAGTAILTAVKVAIQDALGNTMTSATSPVTVTLGVNPTGAALSGTLTRSAVNGVATFGDLSIDKPGAGYAFSAASGILASANSPSFNINPPPTALHIRTTTTGGSIPNNYVLSIDCDSYGYGYCSSPIGVNAVVDVPVSDGDHFVQLGVPDNCAVSGGASRTVTASGATQVPFVVACGALGTLNVTTTTTGTDPNPDGYLVCVDQTPNNCNWHGQARANDAITIQGVLSGPHVVTLTGVGGNCAVGGGPAHPVTVPANAPASMSFDISCVPAERIAFSSGAAISMIHADGTASHFITGGLAPAWSPDGTKLAFECAQDICSSNADGTGTNRLTLGGAVNRHPTWSPDGLKIAFASTANGTADLYVVPATGGGIVRLTHGVGFVGSPAWSPDGTKIAFDCQVDAGNFDICVVGADGTGFARLTSDPASDYGAAWRPDGSTLAFATTRFGFDEVALLSTTDDSVTRLAGGLEGFSPSWSPDGSQLAFVRLYNDPSVGPYQGIVVAQSDGSNVHVVTRGSQPAWRPHR